MIRLKYLTNVNPSLPRDRVPRPEDVVSFLPMERIGENGELDLSEVRPAKEISQGYTAMLDGDVVVAKITPCFENGKGALCLGLQGGVGFGTTELIVLRAMKKTAPRFLYWLTRSQEFRKWGEAEMIGSAGQKRVTEEFVSNFRSAELSTTHQNQIAAYLDEQTTKIDRLMALRRQQMDLLKEQRAAMIQQAVTRGLNPAVPMKDSGVPWLGEIPAHWTKITLGRLATLLQTGPFGSQLHAHEYIEGGIPIINPSHMVEGFIQHDPKCSVKEETAKRLDRHFLEYGDIVFARRGEIGRCALVRADETGWLCGTGSLLMRPDTKILEPAFLIALFQLKHLKESLTLQSVGSTMDNLNTGIISRIGLGLPPLEEQQVILKFIQDQTSKTDDLILSYIRQLTLLAEYRAALIHECVTGQRQVQ